MAIDPRLVQEAARWPVRFSTFALFGSAPMEGSLTRPNNGSISLLRRNAVHYAVTCHHVIAEYRTQLRHDQSYIFAINNCYVDIEDLIVYEDQATDVVVLKLLDDQAAAICKKSGPIEHSFYDLAGQPVPVAVNDYVAFAGYPGDFKEMKSLTDVSLGTFSSGGARVTDRHSDYVCCEFERDQWVKAYGDVEPKSLGGLSGGPAFKVQQSAAGIISYDFAGIIFQIHGETETLYIRHVDAFSAALR